MKSLLTPFGRLTPAKVSSTKAFKRAIGYSVGVLTQRENV